MITLSLPWPPSVNNLFINTKRGRIRSQKYDEWIQLAGWELQKQKAPRITGPVSLSYAFGPPDKRKRDLGNLEKAPTDLLVSHGVIEADHGHIVKEIRLSWGNVEGVKVTISKVASASGEANVTGGKVEQVV